MLTNTSKSVLAKVLACENLSVIYDHSAHTASFDVRNRVLRLPVIKDISVELQDMFVGHEVGHALFTPFTEQDEKSFNEKGNFAAAVDIGGSDNAHIAAVYLNVIEDVRIDRKMKEKFAGLRRDYLIGYKELHDMDFFATKDKDIAEMPFIDRINIHFKSGTTIDNLVKFSDAEQILVDKVAQTRTFDEVIEVTREVWNFALEQKKNSDKNEQIEVGVGIDLDKPCGKSNNGLTLNGIGQGVGKSEGETAKDDGEKAGYGNSGEEIPKDPMMPDRCGTQEAYERKMSSIIRQNRKTVYNQTIPDVVLDNVVIDFKDIMQDFVPFERKFTKEFQFANNTFKNFESSSKNVVNILVKQFLLKKSAEASRRTQHRKTGSLDPVKMMNYHFNDDIFLRHQVHFNGKSHGLVFFMDWSGSMSPVLKDTLHQLFQIVMFCRRMNIPFEVYAFTNHYTKNWDPADEDNDYSGVKEQYVAAKVHHGEARCLSNFGLINILSSRMSTAEYNKMMQNLFIVINYNDGTCQTANILPYRMRLSSTPLNETINAAIQIVNKYKVENKLDIVNTIFLTDGEATGSYISGSGYGCESYIHKKNTIIRVPEMKCGTDALISMFRQMTESKAIGIFLDSKRGLSSLAGNKFFGGTSSETYVKAEKCYRDEGFCVGDKKHHTYDELFIIRGNSSIEDDDIENVLSGKTTKASIRNAFIKTMSNKTTSRVMLNRFIDLIA